MLDVKLGFALALIKYALLALDPGNMSTIKTLYES